MNHDKILEAAERQLRRGHLDKAISLYEELVEGTPTDLRSKLKLADLYSRANRGTKATETYVRVAIGYENQQEFDKAVAVYKVAAGAYPGDVWVSQRLGRLYATLGRQQEAQQVLGDAYIECTKEGNEEGAQQLLELLTELSPEDVGLKIQLAERYQKIRDGERATDMFYRAAELLRLEGRTDELFQVMQRILYLNPESLDARKAVIRGHLERSEERRALKHFRSAVMQAPDDLEILGLLASTFESLGNIDNAVEVYEKMIGLFRDGGRQDSVRQVEDRIIDIAPKSETARSVLRERGYELEKERRNLLGGEDLFGERDVLDDVEFLDDPFGMMGGGGAGSSSIRMREMGDGAGYEGVGYDEVRFSELQPQGVEADLGELGEMLEEAPMEDAEVVWPERAYAPALYVADTSEGLGQHTEAEQVRFTVDEAPTQEDPEPDGSVDHSDVASVLKRVESYLQFNLYAQADELTEDLLKTAPDDITVREQRRRICELLGRTEEAADQLMAMARIAVDQPRVSSRYMSKAMTLTADPSRFEAEATLLRQEWNQTSMMGESSFGESSSSVSRVFSFPGEEPRAPKIQPGEMRPGSHDLRRTFLGDPVSDEGTNRAPLEDFKQVNLTDLRSLSVGAKSKEADSSFDLDFLGDNASTEEGKFEEMFSDMDFELSQFGNQSLSSKFSAVPVAEDVGDPTVVFEVGDVYLQSGRYEEAIGVFEPLLKDLRFRVEAQLKLAEAYAELGESGIASRYVLGALNDGFATAEQVQQAEQALTRYN